MYLREYKDDAKKLARTALTFDKFWFILYLRKICEFSFSSLGKVSLRMRKTKIICTVGPATDKPGVLESMMRAGMNVARFNFSHGAHGEHKKRFRHLREVAVA